MMPANSNGPLAEHGRIHQSAVQGFPAFVIENSVFRAVVIPELGGKIVSLADAAAHHEYLLPSQAEGDPYRRAEYGMDFTASDLSGFDECLPTIAPARVPGAGGGQVEFPDHGEVWSVPWSYTVEPEALVLSISGTRWNYRLTKRMRMTGNVLTIDYELTNREEIPFHFLWSAHPLLRAAEGAKILLPESVNSVMLNWSSQDHLGTLGNRLAWPYPDRLNPKRNYAEVPSFAFGHAVKCFTDRLTEGFAGLYDPSENRSILFQFDPAEIPYVGLWLCYGGWPEDAARKHYTVGLEPCLGRPDALDEAIRRGESAVLDAGAQRMWTFTLSIWNGMPPVSAVSVHGVHALAHNQLEGTL